MPQQQDIRNQHASKSISNRVFYIPFAYYAIVRAGTMAKMLSWLLIYVFPTFFYAAFAAGSVSWEFAGNYLLILLATFSMYELGYIHNDTFATRHEKQPAIRLYEENTQHFYRHWRQIFALRIVLITLCLIGILLYNEFVIESGLTVVSILFIAPVFAVYNYWRNRYNVLLYPILVFSRYIPFLIVYNADFYLYLLLFFSFPCCNMLERFSMPQHRFPVFRRLIPAEQSKTLFRVFYYLVITLVLIPFVLCYRLSAWLLLPFFVLFLYRLALFFITRRYQPRNYLKG